MLCDTSCIHKLYSQAVLTSCIHKLYSPTLTMVTCASCSIHMLQASGNQRGDALLKCKLTASMQQKKTVPTCDVALPVARHSMMGKRNMRLVTDVLHYNVIWYREVSPEVHCMLHCDILCTYATSNLSILQGDMISEATCKHALPLASKQQGKFDASSSRQSFSPLLLYIPLNTTPREI